MVRPGSPLLYGPSCQMATRHLVRKTIWWGEVQLEVPRAKAVRHSTTVVQKARNQSDPD